MTGFVPVREIVNKDGEIEFSRKPGEPFEVGTEETPWPYATDDPGEQALLDAHPSVRHVAVAEVPGEVDATQGARDLAAAEGIELTELEGSGENGRILKSDVEQALAEREEA